MDSLRGRLVDLALEWEQRYGVAPHITAALAEHDAFRLLECPEDDYCSQMKTRTAVSSGYDFVFQGKRYQVKANRPSGKPGSFVTLVAKPKNYDWDSLIWIPYDSLYRIQEAWLWEVDTYRSCGSDPFRNVVLSSSAQRRILCIQGILRRCAPQNDNATAGSDYAPSAAALFAFDWAMIFSWIDWGASA